MKFVNRDPFALGSLIPDDGGSTHLWNVGRQLFYTAVHRRRQFWTVFIPFERRSAIHIGSRSWNITSSCHSHLNNVIASVVTLHCNVNACTTICNTIGVNIWYLWLKLIMCWTYKTIRYRCDQLHYLYGILYPLTPLEKLKPRSAVHRARFKTGVSMNGMRCTAKLTCS
jgi:hypothetical protein